MIAVTVLFGFIAGVLLLPTLADLLSMAVALRGRTGDTTSLTPCDARLLFLVPAHDEERSISSCVESLRAQRYRRDRFAIVVIADNCHDRTALYAREAGAQCLERREPDRPGKPQAIAWALERMPLSPFDAVVIVDADAVVDPGFARELTAAGPLREKAVQPYNDVRNPDDSSLTRMAAVFAAARYGAAYVLKARAGLNVPLSAGMCIGTLVLETHGWTTFSICEDWEWYARLTAAGVTIAHAPGAHLFAEEAGTLRQSGTQRHRWLAGKLAVLLHEGPRIIASQRIGIHQRLDAIAELSAPGPAVHLGSAAALILLAAIIAPPGGIAAIVLLMASLVRPIVYTSIALVQADAPWRALAAFGFLPAYTLWRLGAAAAALAKLGDRRWVRTARRQDETRRPPRETGAPDSLVVQRPFSGR